MQRYVVAAIVGTFLGFAGSPAHAQQSPCGETEMTKSGTIITHAKSVGWFAGVRWGGGILTLNDGKQYKFRFKGVKLLDTGAAATDFEGEIYNLKNIEDVIGVYYGGSKNLKILKGKGEAVMNNSKCVVVKARGKGKGLQFSAPGPAGVHVTLVE